MLLLDFLFITGACCSLFREGQEGQRRQEITLFLATLKIGLDVYE